MDDLKKFSQAVLNGIQGAQRDTALPGVRDIISAAAAPEMRSGMVARASAGAGALAGGIADREEAERKAEQQRKLKEIENLTDPSKYQRVRKDDGGFAFYDPNGNEIDITTYSRRTGLRPADVLKDSDNPLDRQYVNDYANMNDLMQSAFNGDTDTVNSILRENGLNPNTKPDSYMQQLIKRYPHIYGAGSYQQSQRSLNKPIFKIRPTAGGNNYGVTLPGAFGG